MLGADKNPVHLLCAAHLKVAAGALARIYKRSHTRASARVSCSRSKILVQGAAGAAAGTLSNFQELWGGAFWTSSYFCATVGQFGGYESVKRYVEEQGQPPEDRPLWLQFPPHAE